MTMAIEPVAGVQRLSQRLKVETASVHDRLDQRIMAAGPFRDRLRYARFLEVQYRFFVEIEPVYHQPALEAFLPGFCRRSRLAAAVQDAADLGYALPDDAVPRTREAFDLPIALGWLYVAEGSSLGAAFLLKTAGALGLDATHGARHLGGHADGRGRHWRAFTAALDAHPLTPDEADRTIAGARAAFARFDALVAERLG